MGVFLLNAILGAFEVRGHTPGKDDFPERPDGSSFADDLTGLLWILAIAAVIALVLSLVLWAYI